MWEAAGAFAPAASVVPGRTLASPRPNSRTHDGERGPPAEVTKFEAGLRRAGVPFDIHDYDGVNHAFWLHVDQAPQRRTAAALDAWQRLKAYLKRTLGSRGTTG
jgi:dienelactone hydrolase